MSWYDEYVTKKNATIAGIILLVCLGVYFLSINRDPNTKLSQEEKDKNTKYMYGCLGAAVALGAGAWYLGWYNTPSKSSASDNSDIEPQSGEFSELDFIEFD